ncbi:MAG TPA: hypothetical protein PK402_10205, partial [Tepidisphaeraceae bacterium]|nr:hypothetical protein [Tepidisphaeraceae bacterium]
FPLRSYAKKGGRSDRHSYCQLSRFLPPTDMQLYERIGSDVLKPEPRVPIESSAITVNVDRMLGELWK